ncbi:hypothetical protein PLICRDRAFT_119558, partial [Plicaturopsis crispa FD-325 SS-3]
RGELRTYLHDHFDEEFDRRFVGYHRRLLRRTPLDCQGPWHKEHSDGHEKLGEQALNLGHGIRLPIYASKDQFSGYLHACVVLPNVRNSDTIAHYYLDLVESRGYRISLQLTTDKGTEVGKMLRIHAFLRQACRSALFNF